jgi:hypothetical protein
VDQAGPWFENMVRMGSAHGNHPAPIERFPLPQELMEVGEQRSRDEAWGEHSHSHARPLSDGYSWARDWGDVVEPHSNMGGAGGEWSHGEYPL